ncbi:tetratricopeptide repeat protein [Rhizobium sp. SL86]|uniref:tetratricopeptide repeat protein n=1 Tax=Rhizobium sp. SL86 TaxID=2995148 RepID=UPI0022727316|nr:tetratricopeptide repeat protein [Rhizobium sp. SL86]MCY1666807.1 tetratricopeptide repeat protein [Rhizobium sp. SL86]
MTRDAFDLSTSTDSAEAGRAFEEAVYGLATHRPNTGVALQATLRADPDHVAGHALKGFANLILARSELTVPAGDALAQARRALAAKAGGSLDEMVLVEALADAMDGSFLRAADRLDAGFADRAHVFLPFKISHALRFMAGDRTGMLAHSKRAAAVVSAGAPAAGFIYGCYAFCLEEAGDYDRAMRMGRMAVRLQPQDSWGLHAVSHVFEMRGETDEGIDWLEGSRSEWSRCNNFSFHMAWHLALLHLERGDHDRVLALYDDEVRPQPTDDFRDMANAVSLLWRLNRMGVHVGTRWHELADFARARQNDTTLIFAALHNLAALVAVGDWNAVQKLVSNIEAKATQTGDQARVAAEVGVPLARMLAGFDAPADCQMLDRLMLNLPKIGGSNAQRDFFVLALASALGRSGDMAGVSRVRHVRGHLKAEDRLFRRIQHSAGMGLLA